MRYLMKEKWLAMGNDFQILDEQGQQVYFVDGQAFTLGEKLSFKDNDGKELLFIRQRLLAWGHTYEILRGGQTLAMVKKKMFTLLRARFSVDVPGPDDLEAQGDFLSHEYVFSLRGQEVATVSKKWISWTDAYGVDIADGQDDLLILACVVVIDLVLHNPKNH
jgi:uncharacterized protein YxjI